MVSQPSVEAIDEIIYDSSPNDSKEVLGQNVTSPATLEVPSDKDTDSLLPQLWSRARFDALQRQLPNMLPHCSLSGDTPLPEGLEGEIAVVVCYVKGTESTVLLSTHLAEWELTFTDALRFGMKNLQKITKGEAAKKPADRWELHPSGCATSQWLDGSDAARIALLPAVAASRKRAEGDEGGVVAIFASHHIALHAGSKNPLGLCYAGDVANLQVSELLCATPWRLVKALADPNAEKHPLRQGAGPKVDPTSTAPAPPGRVWKWIPYIPGPGEFSVPRDQNEVNAILAACERIQGGDTGVRIPVFGAVTTPEDVEREKGERALKLKEQGGQRFVAQDFAGALTAYAGALQIGGLAATDSAKVHANIAACLLKQGGEERAAKALRAAVEAYELDPSYGKAYFRAAQALEVLGETEAAAEAQAKADELTAAETAAREAKNAAIREKRAAKEAREATLAKERARKAYSSTSLDDAMCDCCDPSNVLPDPNKDGMLIEEIVEEIKTTLRDNSA